LFHILVPFFPSHSSHSVFSLDHLSLLSVCFFFFLSLFSVMFLVTHSQLHWFIRLLYHDCSFPIVSLPMCFVSPFLFPCFLVLKLCLWTNKTTLREWMKATVRRYRENATTN
jgi:hypothetical protein